MDPPIPLQSSLQSASVSSEDTEGRLINLFLWLKLSSPRMHHDDYDFLITHFLNLSAKQFITFGTCFKNLASLTPPNRTFFAKLACQMGAWKLKQLSSDLSFEELYEKSKEAAQFYLVADMLFKQAGELAEKSVEDYMLEIWSFWLIKMDLTTPFLEAHGENRFHTVHTLALQLRRLGSFFQGLPKLAEAFTQAKKCLTNTSETHQAFYNPAIEALLNRPQHIFNPFREHKDQLQAYRKSFEEDCLSVLDTQKKRFEALKTFLKELVEDAVALTGAPRCPFQLKAKGSSARMETTPFSDLEYLICWEMHEDWWPVNCKLMDKAEETQKHREEYLRTIPHYFSRLAKVLDWLVMALGEAPFKKEPPLVYFGLEPPKRFHIDEGGNPANNSDLIRTPSTMGGLISPWDPIPSRMIFQSVPIYSFHADHLDKRVEEELKTISHERRHEITSKILTLRLDDYKKAWENPSYEIDLKKQYIELIHHLIADLAFYKGLFIPQNIPCIDELHLFTPLSCELLKEALAFVYKLRIRLHVLYKENKDICYKQSLKMGSLATGEAKVLDKIYHLIIRPLYERDLPTLLTCSEPIDLMQLAFKDAIETKNEKVLKWIIKILSRKNDLKQHIENFTELSKTLEQRPLRNLYYKFVKEQAPQIAETLARIPDRSGFRFLIQEKEQSLLNQIGAITSITPLAHTKIVRIIIPGKEPFFLKPEAIDALLYPDLIASQDFPGDANEAILRPKAWEGRLKGFLIRKHYPNAAHPVCPYLQLHFKALPMHAFMEYAAHNFYFRLKGLLTPSSSLVRFEVTIAGNTVVYPVLISQTLGQAISKSASQKEPSSAVWESWSWLMFGAILLRFADGHTSNFTQDLASIYSVDNDLLFAEPLVLENGQLIIKFLSALFCAFPEKPLDIDALKAFCQLNIDSFLDDWLDDLIRRAEVFKSLFTEEERSRFFNANPNNRMILQPLFKEGTMTTLQAQFYKLQSEIQERINREQNVCCLDLLQWMISLPHPDAPPDTSVGTYLYRHYIKQWAPRMQNPGPSLTSAEAHRACFARTLKLRDLNNLQADKAKEELTLNVIKRYQGDIFVTKDKKRSGIHGNFASIQIDGKPDREQQKKVLRSLGLQSHEYPPRWLCIKNCEELKEETLKPLLYASLDLIELHNCPHLNAKMVEMVSLSCPQLKKLVLRGCPELKKIIKPGLIFSDPLPFPRLEKLEIEKCPVIEECYLMAPRLQEATFRKNPRLTLKIVKLEDMPHLIIEECSSLSIQKTYQEIAEDLFKRNKDKVIEFFKEDITKLSSLPSALLYDNAFITNYLQIDGNNLQYFPVHQDNELHVSTAVTQNWQAFVFASQRLKSKKDFVFQLAHIDIRILYNADVSLHPSLIKINFKGKDVYIGMDLEDALLCDFRDIEQGVDRETLVSRLESILKQRSSRRIKFAFHSCPVTEEHIRNLRDICELSLKNCSLKSLELKAVKLFIEDCFQLVELTFTAGFPQKYLVKGNTPLQTLRIENIKDLSENNFVFIKSFTSLRSLSLWFCKESIDAELNHIKDLTSLQMLDLSGCDKLTDAGLAHIGTLTSLKALNLLQCYNITDAGLVPIGNLTSLKELNLHQCNRITDAGLAHIRNLTSLQELDLDDCNELTDLGLIHLKNLISLQKLGLTCKKLTDAGLAHMGTLTSLQKLHFWVSDTLTDAGLVQIKKLTSLQMLRIWQCNKLPSEESALKKYNLTLKPIVFDKRRQIDAKLYNLEIREK